MVTMRMTIVDVIVVVIDVIEMFLIFVVVGGDIVWMKVFETQIGFAVNGESRRRRKGR